MKCRVFLFLFFCFHVIAWAKTITISNDNVLPSRLPALPTRPTAAAASVTAETENTPNTFCNPKCDYNGPTIMINEVMTTPKEYNNSIYGQQCPSAQRGGGEWVELYNPDPCNPVDISGYFFGNAIIDSPACNGVPVRGIGGAFIFPEGTIVPPNGFCILLGEFGKEIEPGLLVENGGNTVQIKLMDYFDRFCIDSPGGRFWLPDQGGWFALYDRNGIPQDAIYWGVTGSDICAGCTPCNPMKEGFFMGELPALDAFPVERKHRIRYEMDYLLHEGLTPKRIPDGEEWSYATYTEHNNGYCNADCVQRVSSDCNGTATITTLTTGSYSYLWNDALAQTTATATGLCEGTYCCTVTDNNTKLSEIFCVTVPKNQVVENIIDYLTPGGYYDFYGKKLTKEGIYEHLEKGENDCDKLVILDLRLNLPECMTKGRLLFKEDFGGNEPGDPDIMSDADMKAKFSDTGIIVGYNYNQNPAGPSRYCVRKKGQNNASWIHMDDHTYPYDYTRGYMLQVDGSTDPSGQFYKHQINDLCVGSQLYFSMWAASVAVGYSPGNLSLVIEDLSGKQLARLNTGNIPIAEGETAVWSGDETARNDWEHYGLSFTITDETPSVIFKIMNNNSNYLGNDFVIDDIEIYLCVPPVTVEPVTVCAGEKATLKGEFSNDGSFIEPLVYGWQKSKTGNLDNPEWENTGVNSSELTFSAVKKSDEGYYRLLVVGKEGSIESENCRAESEPVFLQVNDATQITLTESICEGDSYDFYGKILTETGVYKHTEANVSGCENTITLNLSVLKNKTTAISVQICEGETYDFEGEILTESGTYTQTITNTAGCKNVITLTLTVNPTEESAISETICEGETYDFYGQPLTVSGVYTKTIKNTNGCDKTITLTLTVKPNEQTAIEETICEGDSYNFYGRTLTASGVYTEMLTAGNGCRNIVTLTLTVNPKTSEYIEAVIKDSETYFFAGKELSESGIYVDIQKNEYGCDHVITLNLKVLPDVITPPEVFTPNDDGKNDRFKIPNLELYPKNSILIFNRWGNKVFEASPYRNDWDGRNHFGLHVGGDLLPAGTYFYILELGDGSAPRKGYIYLMVEE